ncbi:hypothetical protein CL656_00635 [bacterium]|nr:hypothetical protein [bacterium]|tara:strand:+ start:3608 stop:4300 length:693 start_codon:yes stop_codon:yes gene_type:complete
MKSIIFLLLLLSLSIFAYIKQDDVIDFLVGEEKNQEVQIENITKVDTRSEHKDEFLDFQNSRSLDDDFNKDLTSEKDVQEVENQNETGRENELIKEVLGFENFESQKLNLTYYAGLKFLEVESSLINILKDDQKVGEITLIEDIQESNIESYFKKQSFDLIQDANKQGVYVENFDQSFFEESFKLIGFKGLKIYDYYFLRKNSAILVLKIQSDSNSENFEKVVVSSVRLK